MDDKMCQCGHYESCHGADGSCESSASTGYCPCFLFDDSDAQPDPRDAEIERLKAEVVRLSVDNMKWRQRVKAKEAQEALTPEIRAAFAAIPDMDREAAAALPAALAEVERWKMHHFQVVKDNRRLRRALAAGPAALRIDARDGEPWGPYKQLPVEEAVATVEAAQAAAMKEGT